MMPEDGVVDLPGGGLQRAGGVEGWEPEPLLEQVRGQGEG